MVVFVPSRSGFGARVLCLWVLIASAASPQETTGPDWDRVLAEATKLFERARAEPLGPAERRPLVEQGLAGLDLLIAAQPNRYEALVYKGLFLRLKALDMADVEAQRRVLAEATHWTERAKQVREGTVGAGPGPGVAGSAAPPRQPDSSRPSGSTAARMPAALLAPIPREEPRDADLEAAMAAWEEAYHLIEPAQKGPVVERGLAAVDRSLLRRPEAAEALVYKALLLHQHPDQARSTQRIFEASELQRRAEEIRSRTVAAGELTLGLGGLRRIPASPRGVMGGTPAVSVEDQQALVEDIDRNVRARRPLIDSLMQGSTAEKAIAKSGVPELRSRIEGLIRTVDDSLANLGRTLQQGLATGSLRFLRAGIDERGAPAFLFGWVGNQGGVQYYMFELAWAHGEIFVVDVYSSADGEWLTDNLARAWRKAALSEGMRVEGPSGGDWTRSWPAIRQIEQDIVEGRPRAAHDAILRLPPSLQDDRWVAAQRLQTSQALGKQELDAAMADFRRRVPNDLQFPIVIGGAYLASGQFSEGLAMVEELRRLVGPDPALDAVEAEIWAAAKDLDRARAAAQRAVRLEPTLRAPHDTLVRISLLQADYAETSRLLVLLEKNFGQSLVGIEGWTDFAGFVKSPAYERFKARR